MAEGGRERFVGIVCIGLIENQLRNGMAEKGSHTVLVVDDDPGHRGMLEALLGRWGLAVTSAGDGKEAVARVCERPFDVVDVYKRQGCLCAMAFGYNRQTLIRGSSAHHKLFVKCRIQYRLKSVIQHL